MKTPILLLFWIICLWVLPTAGYSQVFPEETPSVPPETVRPVAPFQVKKALARDQDPQILAMIGEINADSIRATLQSMQDMGSRFLMNDSRKQVAEWLASRFLSWGYTDVVLDSFLCYVNFQNLFVDTLWQYNVVATLPGSSAPSEEYVIGGHYDSFSQPDPFTDAPGVDDNGSAVAVTFEVARVIKKLNFQPEATIRFSLFAAEELGLYGSAYLAEKAREEGRDIRYVLNLDMVAYNPDSIPIIKVKKYPFDEWAAFMTKDVVELYTGLQVDIPEDYQFGGSDSYSYFLNGFPAVYFEEETFNLGNWHHPSDTVGNCNIEYCTEVAKGACATLMQEQLLPLPKHLRASSSRDGVRLSWILTANSNVTGYDVYRSGQPESGYGLIGSVSTSDSVYIDASGEPALSYFYYVVSTNGDQKQSFPSDIVSGARFAFTDTLLVVNSLKAVQVTPDSIVQYYTWLLDTVPFIWHDLNLQNPLPISKLASHRNVLWLANTLDYQVGLFSSYQDLSDFFSSGGNMMVSGFYPSKLMGNLNTYPIKFPDGTAMNDFFKIDTADRKLSSIMDAAYPDAEGYDTLHADTHKSLAAGYPGLLFNVEVYAPLQEGTVIYRFDSPYPPNTSQGAMQDRPIGVEYLGNTYKTILLSFPLYYIDSLEAKHLVQDVLRYKFTYPLAIPDDGTRSASALRCQPNPVSGAAVILFDLAGPSRVDLCLYDMQGIMVRRLVGGTMSGGPQRVQFEAGSLPSGMYQLVLTTETSHSTLKVVVLR